MIKKTLLKQSKILGFLTYMARNPKFNFSKYVFDFEEGNALMKYELGGKGANLCEMTNLGIPVPPGFVISVDACNKY